MTPFKRWFSSLMIAVAVLFADGDPVLAAPTVPFSSAIDYLVEEWMPQVQTPPPIQHGAPSHPVRRLTVFAREYEFVPPVVSVRAGEVVDIVLTNEGKESHNLTFRTLPLKTETIAPGASTQVRLATPGPGRYRFYCSVGNHAAKGMVGVVVVSR